MIKINLLPATMRPVEKARETAKPTMLGKKVLVYVLGGGGAALFLMYVLSVGIPLVILHARLSGWQAGWTGMEKEFKDVEVFDKQKWESTGRLAELAQKKKDRVRWAKILNAVSDVMPPSVQLVRVASAQLTETLPAAQKPPNKDQEKHGAPVPQEKVKRSFEVMELEGRTEKGLLGEEDLKALLEQIRSNPVFEEYFERIDLVGVATLPDLTKKFSLRCRFKEKK